MPAEPVATPNAPPVAGPYSPAVRAGSTVLASVLVPSVQVNVSGSFSGSLEPAADSVIAVRERPPDALRLV